MVHGQGQVFGRGLMIPSQEQVSRGGTGSIVIPSWLSLVLGGVWHGGGIRSDDPLSAAGVWDRSDDQDSGVYLSEFGEVPWPGPGQRHVSGGGPMVPGQRQVSWKVPGQWSGTGVWGKSHDPRSGAGTSVRGPMVSEQGYW